MPTQRAEGVAEVLWRLKRADKLATFDEVAEQAGFRTGGTGKTFDKCLSSVRRDWPHLQWWRAVPEGGVVRKDSEREEFLRKSGFDLEPTDGEPERVAVKDFDEHRMAWNGETGESDADAAPDTATDGESTSDARSA